MSLAGGCVVDASVVLKWVLQEEGSPNAASLLDGRPLFAPDLLHVEVANALWSATRRGSLRPDEADDALDLILRSPVGVVQATGDLAARALRIGRLLDHPVYDCTYLALAMARGVPVVTADRRFATAAAAVPEAAPLVILLAGIEART